MNANTSVDNKQVATDSILSKIRKLLALANSSNVNEAATAAAMADKLIAQYQVDVADLEASSGQEEPIEKCDILYSTGRIIPWKSILASMLANHYGVFLVNDATYVTGRKVSNLIMLGRKSDCEILNYMFHYLMGEIDRLCKINMKGQGHVNCFSYCEGAVNGIRQALNSAKEQFRAQCANSAALIKIDNKLDEAKEYAATIFTNLKYTKAHSKRLQKQSAYNAGFSDGKNISLNKGISTSSNVAGALR